MGGSLILTLKDISGSMTFPATSVRGKPVSPVTVKVGFHPLLSSTSNGFKDTVYSPGTVLI